MAPRRNPLQTDMNTEYLAPENPGKRLRKPRKDRDVVSTTAPEPRQNRPKTSQIDGSQGTEAPKVLGKRARESENDEVPPEPRKKKATIADLYLLNVPAQGHPTQASVAAIARSRARIDTAPESATRSTAHWPDVRHPAAPASPTASDHFDENGSWLEPAEGFYAPGEDPALAPPTDRYVWRETREGTKIHPNPFNKPQFAQDPKRDPKFGKKRVIRRTSTNEEPPCGITAGIPIGDDTPEDLVPHVMKHRNKISAAGRKKNKEVIFTDRPTIRKKSTSTNPPSTSESPIISKPSSSTTGRTSRKTAR